MQGVPRRWRTWLEHLALAGLMFAALGCRPKEGIDIDKTFLSGPDGLGARFTIYVVDVGEGDATLVVGPGDGAGPVALLLDARNSEIVASVLDQVGLKRLHYVVLSQYHPRHMEGFTGEDQLLWKTGLVGPDAPDPEEQLKKGLELAEQLEAEAKAREDSELLEDDEKKDAKDDDKKDKDSKAEPGGYVPPPKSMDAPDLAVGCKETPLFPRRAIVDHGPPLEHNEQNDVWEACVHQVRGKAEHVRVAGGEHVGRTFSLGEGVTARIVVGGGHVWGHRGPVEGVDSAAEQSIALLISNGLGFEFLAMADVSGQKGRKGDADARLEEALSTQLAREGIDIEVLRVGNHGAANATTRRLLQASRPEVAIISTGDDQDKRARNPRCKTLRALQGAGVGVTLQTEAGSPDCNRRDEEWRHVANGTIRVDITGTDYTVSTLGRQSLSNHKRTRKFAFACSVERGCYWFKDWDKPPQ